MSEPSSVSQFIPILRSIVEMIYFICAPILVYIGYKGLKQINIASSQLRQSKEISNLQAKRDAAKLAAQQCEIFAKIVTEEYKNWNEYIDSKKVSLFFEGAFAEKRIQEDNRKMVTFELTKGKFEDYKREISEAIPHGIPLANKLEAFAVYMIKGIADESVTYPPCSDIYCKAVRSLIPLILIENKANNTFIYTLSLYIIWSERREMAKMMIEKNKLEEQLKKMKDISIEPIGIN